MCLSLSILLHSGAAWEQAIPMKSSTRMGGEGNGEGFGQENIRSVYDFRIELSDKTTRRTIECAA